MLLGHMKGSDYPDQYPLLPSFHKRECHSDDADEDSRRAAATVVVAAPSRPKKQKKSRRVDPATGPGGGTGEASIEVVVPRHRGRPRGSKNKPKPPVVVITCDAAAADSPDSMRSHVLEIPAGGDVTDALSRFCRRRGLGISVLAGTGAVSNVTLRQPPLSAAPSASRPSTVTLHGRFDILSISATFFPPSFSAASGLLLLPASGGLSFSISVAGPQGQIVGGSVAGPLVAAGTVIIVAAAFSNPTFHRLPEAEEDDPDVSVSVSASADAEAHRGRQEQQRQHGGGGAIVVAAATTEGESSGMSGLYGHLSHDLQQVWASSTVGAPHPPSF